jgi:hypothetical protein
LAKDKVLIRIIVVGYSYIATIALRFTLQIIFYNFLKAEKATYHHCQVLRPIC